MEPLVYIILVNYNGIEDTIECIESIHKISYENYRIVVVDNHSNDALIIENSLCSYQDIKVIIADENLGFSYGNNIGIKFAIENNADYYLLLNNDTVVDSEFLSKLVVAAQQYKDVGIFTGKIKYYDDRDRIWFAGGSIDPSSGQCNHFGYNMKDIEFGETEVKEISFATGCLMLLSNEAINKAGMLDENFFMYCEDLAYSMVINKHNLKIYYNPDAVIYHKVSASVGKLSKLSQYYMVRNQFYIIKKFVGQENVFKATLCHIKICMKRLIKHDLDAKILLRAAIDGKRNRMGKVIF